MTTRPRGASALNAPSSGALAAPVTSLAGWSAIVLASAASGSEGSAQPLALQPIAGVPLVRLVCEVLREAGCARVVLVTDGSLEAFAAAVGDTARVTPAPPATAAGGALLAGRGAIEARGNVLVVPADLPLLGTRTLLALAGRHLGGSEALTFVTAYLDDPRGHGRIQRRDGQVRGVLREADLSAGDPGATRGQPEVETGVYAADAAWLFEALPALPAGEAPGLGDPSLGALVARAVARGGVSAYQVTEAVEVQRVTDRVQLARADHALRDRIRDRLMRDGVTLMDPTTTYIDAGVRVAPETTLLPGTYLLGATSVGRGCTIGPNAVLRDMVVGDRCEIGGSTLEASTLAAGVTVGPYCHVRPGSTIEEDVHLGNYAEVKASRIGARTAVGHFSYIGDADVGADVNVGAGSITANYDGVAKRRTVIEDGVQLGSDTIMVAPVTIGAGAKTAAGAVVIHDVAPGALVMGVPAAEHPPTTPPATGQAREGGRAT